MGEHDLGVFGLHLQFVYGLNSQASNRSAAAQCHSSVVRLWLLWWGAPVTLLVWLFSQMIELSWLSDAGFCHVSNTDILTKNCVLLAFGIYTVTLRLKYWVIPLDMPVFQGENLEMSLSALPVRIGEGEGGGRASGKIWGRNLETQVRMCVLTSWVLVCPDGVCGGAHGPLLPSSRKKLKEDGYRFGFPLCTLVPAWMTSGCSTDF